jgi:hypothetical protein
MLNECRTRVPMPRPQIGLTQLTNPLTSLSMISLSIPNILLKPSFKITIDAVRVVCAQKMTEIHQ